MTTINSEERNNFPMMQANIKTEFHTKILHDIAISLIDNINTITAQSFKTLEELGEHKSLTSTSSIEEDNDDHKNELVGSLCRNIATSIRELSARLNKLHYADAHNIDLQFQTPTKQQQGRKNNVSSHQDSGVNLQHMVAECRKTLLDCSTALTAAGVASKGKRMTSMKVLTNSAFPLLQSGATQALKISEYISNQEMMIKTAGPVLEMLDILERSAAVASRNIFLNLKLFGMRLATFLELVVIKMKDLRSNTAKINIIAQTDALRKLLPVIIETLPQNSSSSRKSLFTGTHRQVFFNFARASIEKILENFRLSHGSDMQSNKNENVPGFVEPGSFIKKMDQILDTLHNHHQPMNEILFAEVQASAEYIVQFSLSIAKLSSTMEGCENINSEIMSACRNIVSELESLKISLVRSHDNQNCYSEVKLGREVVGDFVEILEQTVNSALLSMIIKAYTLVHLPLDKLILSVNLGQDDDVVEKLVQEFDKNTDVIFQIAHLSTLCCTDKKRSQSINSALNIMETLEKEIVPASLRIRPNVNSDRVEEKNHLRCLRQLWKFEVESLEESLMGIVDPTAFCLLAEREITSCSKVLKNSAYTQNSMFLREELMKIVKISKSVVDFAWKIELDKQKNGTFSEDNQLTEKNPIVKVERSIWEVEAATTLTLKDIDDLNLHKSMLKRIQVLNTAIKDLVSYLMEEENSNQASASSSESHESLGPVSMIKIIKNESTITRTASLNKNYQGYSDNARLSVNSIYDQNRPSPINGNFARSSKSPVKVLTSISRIIVGEDRSVLEGTKENTNAHTPMRVDLDFSSKATPKNRTKRRPGSRSSIHGKSFQNIMLKSALRKPSNKTRDSCKNPVTFDLANQTLERISQSIGSLMPFSTRAAQHESFNTTTNSVYYTPKSNITNASIASKKLPLSVPNEFDLSQILNKLSLLSHELSLSLQQSDDLDINEEKIIVNQEASEIIIKETEELKSINDSIAGASHPGKRDFVEEELTNINNSENTSFANQVSGISHNTLTTNAVIETKNQNYPLMDRSRRPLTSIGNKSMSSDIHTIHASENKGLSPANTKNVGLSNRRGKADSTTRAPSRVRQEIRKYREENDISISTPERKKEVADMQKRVLALLEINQ